MLRRFRPADKFAFASIHDPDKDPAPEIPPDSRYNHAARRQEKWRA
jgi:hypothetical protein